MCLVFLLLLSVILPLDSVVSLFCSLSLSAAPIWSLFLPKRWRKKRIRKILVPSLFFPSKNLTKTCSVHSKLSWVLDVSSQLVRLTRAQWCLGCPQQMQYFKIDKPSTFHTSLIACKLTDRLTSSSSLYTSAFETRFFKLVISCISCICGANWSKIAEDVRKHPHQ